MRGPSISRVMLLIALAGANFGAIRFLLTPDFRPEMLKGWPSGPIPLADGLLISLYAYVLHHRVALRRRAPAERRYFAFVFAGSCGLLLTCSVLLCVFAPDILLRYLEEAAPPTLRFLRFLGVDADAETMFVRYALVPTFLGIVPSGPSLIVAAALASIVNRFDLVILPRQEVPCEAPLPPPHPHDRGRVHGRVGVAGAEPERQDIARLRGVSGGGAHRRGRVVHRL